MSIKVEKQFKIIYISINKKTKNFTSAGGQSTMNQQDMINFLEKYMAIHSPGGYTKEVLEVCKQDFEQMGIETYYTKKGALIARLEGENSSKERVISAHVDTLGGMVKEILPSGKLRFHRIGGGVYNALEGENCTVITQEKRKIRGSIMPLKASTHLYGPDVVARAHDEHSMVVRLDERIGSREDVECLGIQVGDFVCMEPRLEITENGFIKSRYLDNKACVTLLLEICKRWQEEEIKPRYTTLLYMSNYEEMGHGVSAVFSDQVEEFVALDIGIVGEGQTSSEYKVSIAAKDAKTVYDYDLKEKLLSLCKNNEIPYALDVYNKYSSDATQAIHFGCDFKFACIGPGVDATHHYERTHMEALVATSELIEKYLLS